MGVVTALGQDLDTLWNNLVQGKSGVSRIEAFDVSEYPTQIAASVKDFNPEDYVDRKEARKMDRFVQFAAAAAISAMKDSGLTIGETADPERVGVMIGSGSAVLELGKTSTIFCWRKVQNASAHFLFR